MKIIKTTLVQINLFTKLMSLVLCILICACSHQKLDDVYNSKQDKSKLIVSAEKTEVLMKLTLQKLKTFKNANISKGMEIDRTFLNETDEVTVWHVTMLNEEKNIRYFYPFIKYKQTNTVFLGSEIKEKRITLN